MSQQPSIRLVLTPEQREIVRRASGHDIEAIDLSPEDAAVGQAATPVKAGWRLSVATGIPRQAWVEDKKDR
jgi:hypothetical protein